MADLLIDVPIVVDVCLERQPYFLSSIEALDYARTMGHRLWLYTGSLQTMYSVLAHEFKRTNDKSEHSISFQDAIRQIAMLLQKFSEDKQWLAALAGDSFIIVDSHPEYHQLIHAVKRLGQEAKLLTRDSALINSFPQAITPEDFVNLKLSPSQIEFIDLKAQQDIIRSKLESRIYRVLQHGQYIMGPEIKKLEDRLADYIGVKHCITVSSGTDALLIAMMALNIGFGDEVITTPFTFISTAEVIVLLGAKPVFVDIDPRTYNIDPHLIETAITPKTRAIMPVNLYGQCAEFDTINAIATKYGLAVIEDGAQSFGSTYKGRQSCGLSLIGTTSFFPSKPLGCYGDGGACFTNDDELAARIQQIRVHGQDRRYHHPRIGINGRLDTLQAAVLLTKLDIFSKEVETRIQIGQRYSKLLQDFVKVPYIEPYNTSVYAQYTIEVDYRPDVQEHLKKLGIPTAVHYPIPLNLQPALAQSDVKVPNTIKAAQRVLSLPLSPWLSANDQFKIVNAVKSAIDLFD